MASARHQAREAALRALYLWEVGRTEPAQALDTFFAEHQPDAPDNVRAFAKELVLGTAGQVASIDELVSRHTENWRLERLSVIDRLILRMAAWELREHVDTPRAVVLNEALELARTFGTDDSVRFVNGVLDAMNKAMEAGREG